MRERDALDDQLKAIGRIEQELEDQLTLIELGEPASEKEADKHLLAAVDAAAEKLGNTRAVCRSCYVHPAVLDAHTDGSLLAAWKSSRATARCRRGERRAEIRIPILLIVDLRDAITSVLDREVGAE